ncbi:MAG TPA: hypothetical protein VIJ57_10090, partial [Hanamia sp.]
RLEMIMLAFNEEIFPKGKYPLVYMQHELMEYFLYAIVTPKGYKMITKYLKIQSDKKALEK